MNVVVNGLMTNYQKVGSGKIILCLPGWGDTITTFDKLIDELKEKYTVLALDLPGFGGTQAPSKAWSLEDYADFTDAWLKKIKAGKTYAIVGHSYGGATAISGV
ncbi:MAG TPA: alpha/beta hydrolase, partial [Candidatus Saccharimonadales bacterium]|nr:alpha/beta hydrolase [Candidatus Saccharimonadales bacterium]